VIILSEAKDLESQTPNDSLGNFIGRGFNYGCICGTLVNPSPFAMPMVYIQCPVTGNIVPTNHILPDNQKLEQPANRHVKVECEYCKTVHIWDDENGFFLGGNPLNDPEGKRLKQAIRKAGKRSEDHRKN
jgi:hypothetical protein